MRNTRYLTRELEKTGSGKMAALVADYGDSDEESDVNSDVDSALTTRKEDFIVSNSSQPDASHLEPTVSVNFFQSVADDSSSDDEKDCKAEKLQVKGDNPNRLPNPLADRLPSPDSQHLEGGPSVFNNPYDLAERAKNSILEQHVKMTEAKNQGKKNVCFKFQKGKCKFGKNCKFSHDRGPDLVLNSGNQEEEKGNVYESGLSGGGRSVYSNSLAAFGEPLPPLELVDNDSYMAGAKRKKNRAGLSDNLVPSKKAMSSLDRQRLKERPWTLKNK